MTAPLTPRSWQANPDEHPAPPLVAYVIAALAVAAAIGIAVIQNARCDAWAGDDPDRIRACEELNR